MTSAPWVIPGKGTRTDPGAPPAPAPAGFTPAPVRRVRRPLSGVARVLAWLRPGGAR